MVRQPVAAAFVARLRDGGTPLAMVLTAEQGTGSYVVAGFSAGAFGLAAALSRPVHGRLLDRLGQRVLVLTAAGNSLAMIGFVAVVHIGVPAVVTLAVAALIGLLLPAQAAALRALLPGLVGQRLRPAAYAVEANAQELTAIAGPLNVALLVALLSPGGALATLAVIGLAGTVWYARVPAVHGWRGAAGPPRRGGAAAREPSARGSRAPASAIRILMLVVLSISVVLGVVQVAFPAFADGKHAAHLSGVLLAAFASGSLIGGAAYGAGRWRCSSVRQLSLLLSAVAVGVAMLSLAGNMVVMTGLAVVAGLGTAPAFAVTFLACDEVAVPGRTAESFTWLGAANTAGFGLGGAVAGILVERAGTAGTFVLTAGVALVAAVALWARPSGLSPTAR